MSLETPLSRRGLLTKMGILFNGLMAIILAVPAARGLFGEIPINGHLPVTIPGLAQSGDGLQILSRRSLAENSDLQ